MITSLLERICSATGHKIRPLCRSVVRDDRFWLSPNDAGDFHRKERKRSQTGMLDLPFTPGPELAEQQVLNRDARADGAREPRKA